ncbi:unnamed protein product [Linum trigynum]|uniref:Uncharacterized protein n=1 Tax=Linum trigynum TaxID=586398 RepID=A0AAV2C8H9_9ROSI
MDSAVLEGNITTNYGEIIVTTYLYPAQDVLPTILPLPTLLCFDLKFLFLLCFLASTFLLLLTLAMEFYGDFHAPAPAGCLFSLRFGKDRKKMRLEKAAAEIQKGDDNDEFVHKIEVVEDGS